MNTGSLMNFLTGTNPYGGLAMSFAPQLLSMLMGAGSEQKAYQRKLDYAMSPQQLQQFIQQLHLQLNQASQGARTGILQNSLGMQASAARNYAASGAPNGIGATTTTIADSLAGSQLAQLQGQIGAASVSGGQEMYQNNIQNLLQRGPGPISPGHQALASGLDNMRTFLLNYKPKTALPSVIGYSGRPMTPGVQMKPMFSNASRVPMGFRF